MADNAVDEFADEYPEQWRRAGMIPGLRQLIADQLPTGRGADSAAVRRSLGCLLGHGREMNDEQWRQWAQAVFALAMTPTA
ncbi:hypothetical protein ACFQY4_35390 [Catellatospora bangladeshensis]|uniref:Uncharacterized protein n=1 Tax=Catellatospora bangladeshensis TaxID=310355 RepID=A0A8J3JI75_9ACTN|nr:hypothetical protein [Catellatospora bangladeshensis]GIF80932.1 hypothetical protein Cba03nite_22810 [Catellatospora bangladeshensis]